jgi:hypothetical protein
MKQRGAKRYLILPFDIVADASAPALTGIGDIVQIVLKK